MTGKAQGPPDPRPPGSFEFELALKNRALDAADEGITIADLRLPDEPLIFVNQGFERLTSYPAAEVVGRNCRFLQGPGTDPAARDEIRSAVRERRSCVVEILNYRKDGTPFWNRLSLTPLRDASGAVTHYIGVQSDVTERRTAEESLRAANRALGLAGERMRRSLDAAARIQRALLPTALPRPEGVRFAFGFRPCDELAGDALNVVWLDDARLGLYVLDVSGHGVPAALLSVTLSRFLSPAFERSCLLTLVPGQPPARAITPPAGVAGLLNQQFPMDAATAQYFTLLYGVLDVRLLDFRFVAAGHPPPVLARPGSPPRLVAGGGLPIGAVESATFEETRLDLAPGDRLFFYTDGVTEAFSPAGHEFGAETLLARVADTRGLPLQAAVDATLAAVEAHCGDSGVRDDVSLLAAEIVPPA